MGVSYLVNWPIPSGKSPTQAAELLHKRIEALGAKRAGTFAVDCETYQSQQLPGNPSQARDLRHINVFHDSEYPLTIFSLADSPATSGPSNSGTVLVADANFDALMNKLKTLFAKKPNKIESRGLRFEWNDFLVKVGIVSIGPNVKGILLEVEFLPCVVLNDCRELMREVIGGLLGFSQDQIAAPPTPTKANDVFQPKDKIKLYHDNFTVFRKQVGVIQVESTKA